MRETIEFRIPERLAAKHLPPEVGTVLEDIARKVLVSRADPLYEHIGRIETRLRATGGFFFLGWSIRRRYTATELSGAELLQCLPVRIVEPAGEECGTRYDEESGCPACGGGARQVSRELLLDRVRISKTTDYAETIAGERVVSRRFRDVCLSASLTGVEFLPVRRPLADTANPQFFQLVCRGPRPTIERSTRAGETPFDLERFGRCERGDTLGLNLLSEVYLDRAGYSGADLSETTEMIGVRRGLLRPQPLLLLSNRAFSAFRSAKLKGIGIEVAHLV